MQKFLSAVCTYSFCDYTLAVNLILVSCFPQRSDTIVHAFLGVQMQHCYNQVNFFQVFIFVWRQISGGCQMHLPVTQKAYKQWRKCTEQVLQFQLIIQILMTDYLQQEVDISEDMGKGSIASSGPVTIPFTTNSYSRTLHGAVFLCNVHTNNAASDMRTHLDSIVSLWLTQVSVQTEGDSRCPRTLLIHHTHSHPVVSEAPSSLACSHGPLVPFLG